MLKVLIADDKPFIRQGLKCIIDWNGEGFEIAAEADNGKTALELLTERKFDLVIADIKMPEMSGLELLEEVRRRGIADTKFAILSGFFEYDYVKAAMRSNCTDYLLKPVQKDELIKLLRSVSAELNEKKKTIDVQKLNEKVLLDEHLRALIWGKFDEADLEHVNKILSTSKKFRYIGLEVSPTDAEYAALDDCEKRKASKQLAELCEEIISSDKNPVVFDVSKHEAGYDIGIFYSSELAEREKLSEAEYLSRLEKSIVSQYKYGITLYAGSKVEHITELSQSFRSAVVAKTVNVFKADDGESYDGNSESLDKEKLDKLIAAVEANDEEKISKSVDDMYSCINSMDYRLITLNIDYILYHFMHMAQELDKNINQSEIMQYISENTFDMGTVRGSSSHFKKFAIDFSRYLSQLRVGNFSGLLFDIKKDINENYAENISLKSLGEKYYINSAYLGQIFKKQFDISFKDYLNIVRIEEAAKRIVSSNEKIQCIAEFVGYKSMDYFTKKFIAIKGMTPTKLRKMASGTNDE